MRLRFTRLRLVLAPVGSILFVFGLMLIVPLVMSIVESGRGEPTASWGTFAFPAAVSLALGGACRWQLQRRRRDTRIGTPEAMLMCVLAWVIVSGLGALPFKLHLRISYLDAYFEAVSGFTTTGITMLTGLDEMPGSLLMWRSLMQWIGGLGILTFFIFVLYQGGVTHRLFGAESHKIGGKRIAPGMWNTVKVLWLIYVLYTALITGALYMLGAGLFDAVCHGMTCLSTGGYSPHDASIAFYAQEARYRHCRMMEYVIILGMLAGGTNFLVHHRLLRGQVRALWDSAEVRVWWLILAGAVALVMGERIMRPTEEAFRRALFQVVALATTTGFATADIGARDWFSPLARQVFLVLMLIGGCAGSTSGGLKVIRIVILWKLMTRHVRRALRPDRSVDLVLLDGQPLPVEEAHRTAALFFAWILLLFFGAAVTASLSSHGATASASGMFSALGNIGPCYISVQDMIKLRPFIKLVYIAGMLAGRLEIIPLLILFSRRTWE